MDKEQMKKQFYKIQKMDKQQVLEFSRKVSLANLDKKAQSLLFRAIEIRMCEIENEVSPLVESGEIKIGEQS